MYEMGLIIGFVIFGLPLLIPAVYLVGLIAGVIYEMFKLAFSELREIFAHRRG